MADNKDKAAQQEEKAARKAEKEAAKQAEKERKARIERNKPAQDPNRPNIFVRMINAIKRFFKDFKGTTKKVTWPDGKTVFKSSGVVIVCVLIVGVGIWIADWAISGAVKATTEAIEGLNEVGTTAAVSSTDPTTPVSNSEITTAAPIEANTQAGEAE